ncbi:hypothetical protein [Taklimakanibacter deserti]|uniref:hypothetical protein n=1 Tax=Taklimakanibacter deserti TaxID=2267839 RepID=UPI000E647599
MRVVVSAVLIFWASLCGDAFGGSRCASDETRPEKSSGGPHCSFDDDRPDQSAPSRGYSTFRGIGLASRPEDVQRIGQSLGYEVDRSLFVGDDAVAAISLYKDCRFIGRADFDRQGRMLRLALKEKYFCDETIFVRRFAEALFARYGVTPLKVDDDVCFQDVTCFKGVSKHGEQFLILRIGVEAELYVRP